MTQDGIQDDTRDFESLDNYEGPEDKRRRIDDNEELLQNALHCMKTLLDTSAKRDEHSIFGEHVANKIRTCSRDNSEINIAQHHIENIVFNLCTGVYNGVATIHQTPTIPTVITSGERVIIPKMEPEL